jgi:phenylacetate-CoA ligase
MRKLLIFTLLRTVRVMRDGLARSENAYKILFIPGGEAIRWRFGKWKAWLAFDKAQREAPAYTSFLKTHRFHEVSLRGWDPMIETIPVTDKESYVKKYSIEARCHGGALPTSGVVIDESSGTSGSPNNWVRGPEERAAIKQGLQFALHHLIGDEPIFAINAFALGPWATGMNVSMSIVDVAVLKSTGPDAQKIINTLKFFGPKYRYVIMGYPPFLKSLVDSTEVNWADYNIVATYGGEGMSEGMRSYLEKFFSKVYGSYGASDLEINIGAENDYTIALRRLLASNEKLRAALLRKDIPGLPMIFQYNPFDYYIETSKAGELIVTLCRAANTAPKIRYNIHDTGYVVRVKQLKQAMRIAGLRWNELPEPRTDLPLLLHYGRADMAVAFYGSKITRTTRPTSTWSLPWR